MNTNLKGQNFENMVYGEIRQMLENNDFIVPSDKSKIFQKKPYFSKDRDSAIITDISIETSMPGAKEYSILIVIECKDYSSPIPVTDIEEFHAKVQQISGDNVKAIFVTTAAFQKSALAYARSKGIALIRLLPASQVVWVLFEMTPDEYYLKPDTIEFETALENPQHIGIGRDFFSCYGQRFYGGLRQFLEAVMKD